MHPARVPAASTSYCVLLPALLACCVGCGSSTAAPLEPTRLDASGAAHSAVAEFDQNKDGALSAAELAKCPSLKAALAKADADADKRLTEGELSARIARYTAAGVALMPAPVTVTVDGKPLAGATVTFTPEKFLGAALAAATGETDQQGTVRLQAAGAPAPGLAPGLYRVTISKRTGDRETLPARYNTASELGLEVAIDVESLLTGIKFDLQSR